MRVWKETTTIVVLKQTSRSFGRNLSSCFETFCSASFLATATACVKTGAGSLNAHRKCSILFLRRNWPLASPRALGRQLALDKVNTNNNVNNCLKVIKGIPLPRLQLLLELKSYYMDRPKWELVINWARVPTWARTDLLCDQFKLVWDDCRSEKKNWKFVLYQGLQINLILKEIIRTKTQSLVIVMPLKWLNEFWSHDIERQFTILKKWILVRRLGVKTVPSWRKEWNLVQRHIKR